MIAGATAIICCTAISGGTTPVFVEVFTTTLVGYFGVVSLAAVSSHE
jgi:hypothetical protein